jgi:hypothetical protein
MANKKVQIQIDTKATGNGAKEVVAGLQQVDTAAKKTSNAVNTTTANTGRMGQIAGQAGFQIQDFAVQVGAGTSALTAFSQQAPQLLGVFGPGGAIAGAIVAIGAVAAKVFIDMAKNAEVTGEAMEDMSEKLKEAFSESAKKSIEDFNDAIERTTSQAQSLREASLQVASAQRERDASNKSLIDSQLKLDEAQIKYLASTGQIKDEEQALLAVRQKAAEETKKAQVEAAQGQVIAAQEQYNALVVTRQDVFDEISRAQKQLAELEARQAPLMERQALSRSQDRRAVKVGREKEGFQSLETQALGGQLSGIEKEIENLYKIIESGPKRLQAITDESYVKLTEMSAVMTNAETQIAEIEGKFALSQKAEQITTATTQIGQSAQEITAAMNEFQPVTQAQADAKTAIQQAASDGIITAQEQQKIAANLQMLMSSIQTGQQSSIATLQELIQINNQLALKMGELNKETNALRRQVNSLQGIR